MSSGQPHSPKAAPGQCSRGRSCVGQSLPFASSPADPRSQLCHPVALAPQVPLCGPCQNRGTKPRHPLTAAWPSTNHQATDSFNSGAEMPTTGCSADGRSRGHKVPRVLSGAFSYPAVGSELSGGRACRAGTSPAPPPLSGGRCGPGSRSAALVPVLAGAGSTTGPAGSSWAALVLTGVSLNRGLRRDKQSCGSAPSPPRHPPRHPPPPPSQAGEASRGSGPPAL